MTSTLPEEAVKAAATALANYIGHGMTEKCVDKTKVALTAALPFLPVQGAVKDVPLGAIENGRVFLQRLADHYDFTCEAGSLANCADFHEAVRCFEHTAQWISDLSALEPSNKPGTFDLDQMSPDQRVNISRPESQRALEPSAARFPCDPTDEMVEAALAVDWENEDERATVINIWHAMTAKLPTLQPSAARELALEEHLHAIEQQLAVNLGYFHDEKRFLLETLQTHITTRIAAIRVLSSLDHADAGKVEGDGWRPIESAPKDGTVIQVWHQVHKCPISVLWKDDGFPYRGKRLNWYERTYTTAWPEHVFFYWRHLPSAPSEGAE